MIGGETTTNRLDAEAARQLLTRLVKPTGVRARLFSETGELLGDSAVLSESGRIHVTLERVGSHLELAVRDNGIGIPEDLLPAVFERFARGDASRSRQAGSTGLGLALVRAIVTAHDGTVTVESVPGRTVFAVTLPAVRSTPSPPSQPDHSLTTQP